MQRERQRMKPTDAYAGDDLPDLFELYNRCQNDEFGAELDALINAFLQHPASRKRRRRACNKAMGTWRSDPNLRSDVIQEANCAMTQLLRDRALVFKGTSLAHFGNWLSAIWYCRCCDAWRNLQTPDQQSHRTRDNNRLDKLAAPPDRDESAEEVYDLIRQIDDPLVESVMVDRAIGLTVRESAAKRGLSKSYVCALQLVGIERIRMIGRRQK